MLNIFMKKLLLIIIFLITIPFVFGWGCGNMECEPPHENCYNCPGDCNCGPGYVCNYVEKKETYDGSASISLSGVCMYVASEDICVPGNERNCEADYDNPFPGVTKDNWGQECIDGNKWGSCIPRQRCGQSGAYVNCAKGNGFLLYHGICTRTRITGDKENEFWALEDCENASQNKLSKITGEVTQNTKDISNNNFLIIVLSTTFIFAVIIICLTVVLIKKKEKD
jgi:hypothetical protein